MRATMPKDPNRRPITTTINVVVNWFDELRAKAPAGR
jgi:hypothetical protein